MLHHYILSQILPPHTLPFRWQNYFLLFFKMIETARHHVCHCLQSPELGKHWPLQVSAWGGVGFGAKFVCTHLRLKTFISTLACSRMRRVYSVKSGTLAYGFGSYDRVHWCFCTSTVNYFSDSNMNFNLSVTDKALVIIGSWYDTWTPRCIFQNFVRYILITLS